MVFSHATEIEAIVKTRVSKQCHALERIRASQLAGGVGIVHRPSRACEHTRHARCSPAIADIHRIDPRFVVIQDLFEGIAAAVTPNPPAMLHVQQSQIFKPSNVSRITWEQGRRVVQSVVFDIVIKRSGEQCVGRTARYIAQIFGGQHYRCINDGESQ